MRARVPCEVTEQLVDEAAGAQCIVRWCFGCVQPCSGDTRRPPGIGRKMSSLKKRALKPFLEVMSLFMRLEGDFAHCPLIHMDRLSGTKNGDPRPLEETQQSPPLRTSEQPTGGRFLMLWDDRFEGPQHDFPATQNINGNNGQQKWNKRPWTKACGHEK